MRCVGAVRCVGVSVGAGAALWDAVLRARLWVLRSGPADSPPRIMLLRTAAAECITLPFKAVALIQEHGRTRLDVTVKVKSTFPLQLFATNLVLLVPVPDQTARATFNLTAGLWSAVLWVGGGFVVQLLAPQPAHECLHPPLSHLLTAAMSTSINVAPYRCRQGQVRPQAQRPGLEDQEVCGGAGAHAGGERGAHRDDPREAALEPPAALAVIPGVCVHVCACVQCS